MGKDVRDGRKKSYMSKRFIYMTPNSSSRNICDSFGNCTDGCFRMSVESVWGRFVYMWKPSIPFHVMKMVCLRQMSTSYEDRTAEMGCTIHAEKPSLNP